MSDDGTSAIDDFLLDLTGKDHPRVCLMPTASGDADSYAQRFEAAFAGRAPTSVLSLFCHEPWGLLREAAANGTILARISAGMSCWFDGSSTDSFGPLAPLADGLGFVPASACPHYLGEPERPEKYRGWVADGSLGEGYAADDYTALLFRDGEFVEAVAERPGHPAFRVERVGAGESQEVDLPVRLLR